MAETSYPFSGGVTTDSQFSEMFRSVVDSGVVGSAESASLRVSGDSTGLNVKVAPGFAFVRGHAYKNDSMHTLPIDPGDTQPRIDSVILRLAYGAVNACALAVKKGQPAAGGGAAPVLEQTDTGVFELLLGNVAVASSAATITSANVTDARAFTGSRWGYWGNSTRPASPRLGTAGYNHTLKSLEWWDGSGQWKSLAAPHDINGTMHTGVLGVAKGGTGATTAASALQSLGIFVQPTMPVSVAGRVWIKG